MIGRVIDKYKIVEEVGQGGMSVVYKGMDTSLNREVAVKVLHPHLASSAEARKRFEREAHAVAKLRHENILEIYDYSGKDSKSSYIVTELIRGRTLRSFIGEHPLAFPEIAALIVVEICRALAHAHNLGVLHRDVKPENIMIREDGVLKLMDFGIAQIVDSQRMTVTGQLLGSPAYMSPEHVEGRPLDFRTDVFSVGILLYQLATGELPFKGRNPHEILKRIADCRYLDPRVVNPLVADRLGRIIARALARLPEDRYPDVAIMLHELEMFLAEVDLTDPRSELKRFFAKPLPYEKALRERLTAALTRAGKNELAGKRTARALELWNRVLTIDPAHDEVLRLIDRLSRRRRLTVVIATSFAAIVVASGGLLLYRQLERPAPAPPPDPRAVEPMRAPVPAPEPAPTVIVAAAVPDAAPPEEITIDPDPPPVASHPVRPPPPATHPDVPGPGRPQPAVGGPRTFHVVAAPKNASYSLDGGAYEQITMGSVDVEVGAGAHKLRFRHPLCQDTEIQINASEIGGPKFARLNFKPTWVRPRCDDATAITVNGKPADSGAKLDILEFLPTGKQRVNIEFKVGDKLIPKTVNVTAGDPPKEVTCDDG